jgi:hypothetical protein
MAAYIRTWTVICMKSLATVLALSGIIFGCLFLANQNDIWVLVLLASLAAIYWLFHRDPVVNFTMKAFFGVLILAGLILAQMGRPWEDGDTLAYILLFAFFACLIVPAWIFWHHPYIIPQSMQILLCGATVVIWNAVIYFLYPESWLRHSKSLVIIAVVSVIEGLWLAYRDVIEELWLAYRDRKLQD